MIWVVIIFVVGAIILSFVTGAFNGQISTWHENVTNEWFGDEHGYYPLTQGGENGDGANPDAPDIGVDGGSEPSTPGYDHNAPELHPDDGTTPQAGDEYEYGDYVYTYTLYGNSFGASTFEEGKEIVKTMLIQQSGMSWDETVAFLIEQGAIQTEDDIWPQFGLSEDTFQPAYGGWSVKVKDNTKTEYGPILESINGEPVVSVAATFYDCKSLKISPVIPNSVRDMQGTFYNCISLETAPVIPNGVYNMASTFSKCTNLTTAPVIPNGVLTLAATFHSCESLINTPVIPDGVISMATTFLGCSSLTKTTNIPSSVKDITNTFYGCTLMTGEISIPCRFADENYEAHWPDNTTITLYHIDGCDGSCGA